MTINLKFVWNDATEDYEVVVIEDDKLIGSIAQFDEDEWWYRQEKSGWYLTPDMMMEILMKINSLKQGNP